MAITRTGTGTLSSFVTSPTATYPTTAANTISILFVFSGGTVSTPAGWTLLKQNTSTFLTTVFWQFNSVSKSGSVVVTTTAAANAVIMTYSGAAATLPTVANTGTSFFTSPIATTAQVFSSGYALLIIAGQGASQGTPAPSFSAEQSGTSGVTWTASEALDSALGVANGNPGALIADGPVSSTTTATSLQATPSVSASFAYVTISLDAGAAASSGDVKVYNGAGYAAKPVKVWSGSTWAVKPVKYWDGASWVPTKY